MEAGEENLWMLQCGRTLRIQELTEATFNRLIDVMPFARLLDGGIRMIAGV